MRMPDHVPPTPERMRKGGLRAYHDTNGHYLGCTREPDTVLGALIESGTIEMAMQDVADTLHEWKRAFLSPVRSHSRGDESASTSASSPVMGAAPADSAPAESMQAE